MSSSGGNGGDGGDDFGMSDPDTFAAERGMGPRGGYMRSRDIGRSGREAAERKRAVARAAAADSDAQSRSVDGDGVGLIGRGGPVRYHGLLDTIVGSLSGDDVMGDLSSISQYTPGFAGGTVGDMANQGGYGSGDTLSGDVWGDYTNEPKTTYRDKFQDRDSGGRDTRVTLLAPPRQSTPTVTPPTVATYEPLLPYDYNRSWWEGNKFNVAPITRRTV